MMTLCLFSNSSLIAQAQTKPEASFPKVTGTCDRACLEQTMQAIFAAATSKQFGKVLSLPHAEIRENARVIALPDTTLAKVRVIRSALVFADALTGNVVARTGVEMADGNPGYLSTRLKAVADGKIADIEISADTSNRVMPPVLASVPSKVIRPGGLPLNSASP